MNKLFLDNKYTNCYMRIITSCKNKSRKKLQKNNPNYKYFERHHIIPKSLTGNNSDENLVLLTPKEHYICHLLLTRMCDGNAHQKMLYAYNRITNKTKGKINSSMYQKLREEFSNMRSKGSKGNLNNFSGKSHKQETKDYLSIVCPRYGKNNGMFGKSLPETTKNAISKNNKLRHDLGTLVPPPPQKGAKNNFAKYYSITFPNGTTSIIKCLREFTKKYNLCPYTIKIWKDKGTIPVLTFERPYRVKNMDQKVNCQGFSISSIGDPSAILPSIDHTVIGN